MKALILLSSMIAIPPTIGYLAIKLHQQKHNETLPNPDAWCCMACDMGDGYTCLNDNQKKDTNK